MDRTELQARKDQLWDYMNMAKTLVLLLDEMQVSGTRANMWKAEELIEAIRRMN